MIEDHLRLAEKHVAQGRQHLANQRDIIARLQRDGLPTAQAETMLGTFEMTQRSHVAERDRLRCELAAFDAGGTPTDCE